MSLRYEGDSRQRFRLWLQLMTCLSLSKQSR